jgi:hypothetical protein
MRHDCPRRGATVTTSQRSELWLGARELSRSAGRAEGDFFGPNAGACKQTFGVQYEDFGPMSRAGFHG